jgi:hypothetical protein
MTAEEIVDEEEMGRGARSKKKRRFRSLSPSGRDTPDANGAAGYGGGAALTDDERRAWRCAHCLIWGPAVWAVRDGPTGSKVCLVSSAPSEYKLTTPRHSVIIAAFYMSEISSCRPGRRTTLLTSRIRACHHL